MALAPIDVYPLEATYKAQKLNTYTDMADVLDYLINLNGAGYTGNITASGPGQWTLWFQSTSQNSSWNADLGDWVIVKNNSIASAFKEPVALANYTATAPAA